MWASLFGILNVIFYLEFSKYSDKDLHTNKHRVETASSLLQIPNPNLMV